MRALVNYLWDMADEKAVEDPERVVQETARIASDESEQELGVVLNGIIAHYFGFGINHNVLFTVT